MPESDATNRWRTAAAACLLAVTLAACGGGGGGSAAPAPTPAPAPASNFPVLVTTPDFSLPAIAEPPDRTPVAGRQLGRVLLDNGAPAPAGLTVELVDASDRAALRVLASAVTDGNGAFNFAGSSSAAPADQWLRVALPDGTTVRAFAGGWTELSVGTEVAVREITRLRNAGALAARVLPMAELAAGQQSLGLLWQAKYANLAAPAAAKALAGFVALFQPWNQYLERLASATPDGAPIDIAGLFPSTATDIQMPGTLTEDGASVTASVSLACNMPEPRMPACAMSVANRDDLSEQFITRDGGIVMIHNSAGQGPEGLLFKVAFLPIIEFAPAVGKRIIQDTPQWADSANPTIRAAIKVTRRTYPAAPVQALGGTVLAIEVVLDYEIAILNTDTKSQGDILMRERRWFSPLGARVKVLAEGLARSGGTVERATTALTLDSSAFPIAKSLPVPGVIDAKALPLIHRHVIYSAALNRLFVATDGAGGQVLELDPATLATMRTVATPGVPGQLAVSNDGSTLYAGLDGGTVLQLRTADLATMRQFSVGASPYGDAYDRVRQLAVDPFDAERVLVLAGTSKLLGQPGPVLLYASGNLVIRNAPRWNAIDYGWSDYMPGLLAWTSVRDEFLIGSNRLYRLRVAGTAFSDVTSVESVGGVEVLETHGELLTRSGTFSDALTLAPLRALRLGGYVLDSCVRLDATSSMCSLPGSSGTTMDNLYVRLDNTTGEFLGAYRPDNTAIMSQCPMSTTAQVSLASGTPRLTTLGGGRILVSNGDGTDWPRCGIQLWTLRGY